MSWQVADPGQFPKKRIGLEARPVDGRTALVDEQGRRVCFLNETALALWDLCDGATTPREMVDAIRIACGLPENLVVQDVERALSELTNAGLVSWEPADE